MEKFDLIHMLKGDCDNQNTTHTRNEVAMLRKHDVQRNNNEERKSDDEASNYADFSDYENAYDDDKLIDFLDFDPDMSD